MATTDLFDPFEHRGLRYANRIMFSPLTRARASSQGVPGELQAEYYRQRASAGLIMSEAIAVSPAGRGGGWCPGLWSEEQVTGWRLSTEAVHAEGGKIFAQLWHAGRLSHSSLSADGTAPLAPASVRPRGKAFTEGGFVYYEQPRAISTEEVAEVVTQFRRAADNAMRAGFDGVELHAAHGYLPDSFLRDAINDRTDRYGGSIENRARFVLEALAELVASAGADRVCVRLSPGTQAGGMRDSDPMATFGYVIEQMNKMSVAWLDLVEGDNLVSRTPAWPMDTDALAARFQGGVMVNNMYDLDLAVAARLSGKADMVAFGRAFIANPDLVRRLQTGAPLAEASIDVWYGGGAKGLIDFPALA